MKEYSREYPLFSLCGLNCGLCPRYQSKGASRCPGCGGEDFHLKHPACAVITCNKKHDNVEFCYRCSAYPCERYAQPSSKDSFITYQKVLSDVEKAISSGLESYKAELNEKIAFLGYLIDHYNDSRRMNFYCIAVNLLSLNDLRDMRKDIDDRISKLNITQKEKIDLIVSAFEAIAGSNNIDLRLRK